MNDLTTFSNPEFGQVRTVELDGQPWLVGADVATALGYKNPRKALADHIEPEDKGVTKRDTPGGEQEILIINESGLYSLILSSKMPEGQSLQALGHKRGAAHHPQDRRIRELPGQAAHRAAGSHQHPAERRHSGRERSQGRPGQRHGHA